MPRKRRTATEIRRIAEGAVAAKSQGLGEYTSFCQKHGAHPNLVRAWIKKLGLSDVRAGGVNGHDHGHNGVELPAGGKYFVYFQEHGTPHVNASDSREDALAEYAGLAQAGCTGLRLLRELPVELVVTARLGKVE